MVDGAKFWISYQRPAFLSISSHWQLIQNLAPFTIMWHQCDIRIRKTWTPLLVGRLPFFETMKIEETQKLILLKNGVFVALLEWQVNYTKVLRLLWTLYSSVLGKGLFFNYVDQILPCIDHLPTPSLHWWRNYFTVINLHNMTVPVPPKAKLCLEAMLFIILFTYLK